MKRKIKIILGTGLGVLVSAKLYYYWTSLRIKSIYNDYLLVHDHDLRQMNEDDTTIKRKYIKLPMNKKEVL